MDLSELQEAVLAHKGDVDAAMQAMQEQHSNPPQSPPTPQPASQEPVFARERKDSWGTQGLGDHSNFGSTPSEYAASGHGNGHSHTHGEICLLNSCHLSLITLPMLGLICRDTS